MPRSRVATSMQILLLELAGAGDLHAGAIGLVILLERMEGVLETLHAPESG
jgi:hypothetical protein